MQGPMTDLVVQRFGFFRDLEGLRAEANELESENQRGRDHLGTRARACGLVWRATCVPERGFYKFSLEASTGAALLIYGEEQVSSISGSESARVLCRGRAPVRVEYFQRVGNRIQG